MSSESEDMPLAPANGRRASGTRPAKTRDAGAMAISNGVNGVQPALSIRNGPVVMVDADADGAVDLPEPPSAVNGKRKSRSSISKINYEDKSSDSDDEPLAKRQKPNLSRREAEDESGCPDDTPISEPRKRRSKLPPSYRETALAESSSDDEPLGTKLAQRKIQIEKDAETTAKKLRAGNAAKSIKPTTVKEESDSDSSDDVPLAKASGSKRQPNGAGASVKKKGTNGVKKRPLSGSDDDDDAPLSKSRKKKATPAQPKTSAAKKKAAAAAAAAAAARTESEDPANGEDEEDEDGEYAWWNEPKKEDDSVKWNTLEHSGVMFPPAYQPLPPHIKLVYGGVPVTLNVVAEEVAWFFGSMLNSKQHVESSTFQNNFFRDFKDVLKETGGARDGKGGKIDIRDFAKLDFASMWDYHKAQTDARKARSKAEKKAETDAKKEQEAPFKFCTWDGRKEQVGNFRVEPPGLFRGRGDHPKTGTVKRRVNPEQVTINIGKGAKVPEPPAGHKWKEVKHDNKATWLATWQENVNNQYKYVMLAASSAVKGQSDFNKFEKARELKLYIDKIRKDYKRDLKSEVMADRQRATAMYLIDELALRAGNEKDAENEAETVGCCSLKYEHITLKNPNIVVFDFLGKDSIRYYDEVKVDLQVFKNLKLFKRAPKKDGDDIFDRLNTTQLNKHLSSYMKGLTAKVFRTYNASWTMSRELKQLKHDGRLSLPEKVALYNECNRKVAILCNHKRTVGEAHDSSMKRLEEKLKGIKYQKWRLKQMILDVDSSQKKKKGAKYFELDEGMDEAWKLEHQLSLVEQQRTQITKKFEKENEKLEADGGKRQPQKELKDRLRVADELAAKFKDENKTKKVKAEGKSPTVAKIEANIDKMDQKIHAVELDMQTRDKNKEVALGTSKINYIDPRLTVVFAKKMNVAIDKFFSKTLREKFNWAIKSVEDENWEF